MATSVIAAGIVGMLIGSFLNVVIYRVPRRLSIVSPPSACPSCEHRIRAYDNIPIISWLILRGRCRDCSAQISVRYPIIELAAGIAFALVVAGSFLGAIDPTRSGPGSSNTVAIIASSAAFLYFAAISIALAIIDIDCSRLPNSIVLPAYGVGAALFAISAGVSGTYIHLLSAAIGAVLLFVAYLAMALLYRGGMGFGDVKLAGVVGLYLGWLGWDVLAVGAMAAFVLGGVYAIGLLVARKAQRATGVPFGPWMLGGAWVGILAGPQIATGYLSIFGLGNV